MTDVFYRNKTSLYPETIEKIKKADEDLMAHYMGRGAQLALKELQENLFNGKYGKETIKRETESKPFKCPNCEGHGRIEVVYVESAKENFIKLGPKGTAECIGCEGKGIVWRE